VRCDLYKALCHWNDFDFASFSEVYGHFIPYLLAPLMSDVVISSPSISGYILVITFYRGNEHNIQSKEQVEAFFEHDFR